MDIDKEKLYSSGKLQHYYKSDHPPVSSVTAKVWGDIVEHRKKKKIRIIKGHRQREYVRRLIISLHIAAMSGEPWKSVSLNRNDYSKGTRQFKLFLRYRPFMGVIKDLEELDYIHIDKGDNYWKNMYSRIRATPKLLELMDMPLSTVRHDFEYTPDPIVLKDGKKAIEYEDTHYTNLIRKQIAKVNEQIDKTDITCSVDGIDTLDKLNYRVFIDGKFTVHGRIYNRLLAQLKREERPTIKLDGEEVVELDFKCLHPTILYAEQGLTPPPDSYAIPGQERELMKDALVRIINGEEKQLGYIPSEMRASIEQFHAPIASHFYSREEGQRLMWLDSTLANYIIIDLAAQGVTCLPLHDSFIVARQHETLLRATMVKWFRYMFKDIEPIIDKKY